MEVTRLIELKEKIDNNLPDLQKKQPIAPLIAQSIEILIDMKASEEEIHSWAQIQRKFIKDIEKELLTLHVRN